MDSAFANPTSSPAGTHWSAWTRCVATIAILAYLAILVLGPLTNPIAAPHLTAPLARAAQPVQQMLFLGHGYRFFGPDPGASHSVLFTVQRGDGEIIHGHFPDRHKTSPRLLYHRWFMLSETLYREGSIVPTMEQVREREIAYQSKMDEFLKLGKLELRKQLAQERLEEKRGIAAAKERRDLLIRAIGRVLLDRHQGDSIRLAIRARALPTPEEVLDRIPLDDDSFVSVYEIGTFSREQLVNGEPLSVVDPSSLSRPDSNPAPESIPVGESAPMFEAPGSEPAPAVGRQSVEPNVQSHRNTHPLGHIRRPVTSVRGATLHPVRQCHET